MKTSKHIILHARTAIHQFVLAIEYNMLGGMSIFMVALVISLVFLFAKFIEMRFVEKESRPFKFLARDALVVYFSVLVANFLAGQLQQMVPSNKPLATPVFTDNPGF